MDKLVEKRMELASPREIEELELVNYTKPSQLKTMRDILNRYSRGEFVPRLNESQESPTSELHPVEDYHNPLEQQQRVADWLDDFKTRSEHSETHQNSTNDVTEVQTSPESVEGSPEPSN